MTITMTAKHQLTIPKKIAEILGLDQGAMFNVAVRNGCIELIPLEVVPREFSDEVYAKLDKLSRTENGKEKKVSKKFINNLNKGKV